MSHQRWRLLLYGTRDARRLTPCDSVQSSAPSNSGMHEEQTDGYFGIARCSLRRRVAVIPTRVQCLSVKKRQNGTIQAMCVEWITWALPERLLIVLWWIGDVVRASTVTRPGAGRSPVASVADVKWLHVTWILSFAGIELPGEHACGGTVH